MAERVPAMRTKDEVTWREEQHRRDNNGQFSETGGGGGSSSTATAERPTAPNNSTPSGSGSGAAPSGTLPKVAAISHMRPDPAAYRTPQDIQYFTNKLAAFDRALALPSPAARLAALQAISVPHQRTRLFAYKSKLIELHGGEPLVRPSPDAAAIRTVRDISNRASAAAGRPAAPTPPAAPIPASPAAPAPPPAAPVPPAAPRGQRGPAPAEVGGVIRPVPANMGLTEHQSVVVTRVMRDLDAAYAIPEVGERYRAINSAIRNIPTGFPRTSRYAMALREQTSSEMIGGGRGGHMGGAAPTAPAQPAPPAAPPTPGVPQRQYSDEGKRTLLTKLGANGLNLANAVVAGFPQSGTNSEVTSYGDDHVSVSHRSSVGSVTREFHPQGKWVYHAYQALNSQAQGNGTATKNLLASVQAYKAAGYKKVKVHAALDVGGYAWAKFGFVPDPAYWGELSPHEAAPIAGRYRAISAKAWRPRIRHRRKDIEQSEPESNLGFIRYEDRKGIAARQLLERST